MRYSNDWRLMNRLRRVFERLDSHERIHSQPWPSARVERPRVARLRGRERKALEMAARDLAEYLAEYMELKDGAIADGQHEVDGRSEAAAAASADAAV